jgi:hypothetical protein
MLLVAAIYATLWICSTSAGTIPTTQVDDLPWPLVLSESDYQLSSDNDPPGDPATQGEDFANTIAHTDYSLVALDDANPKNGKDVSRRDNVNAVG